MTNVLIDMEIVKAIGLSITFMGVMLSIVAIGIAIFIYKSSKQKGRQYLKMAGLILGWSVFIVLSNVKEFFNISISYFGIIIGVVVILIFLFMLPNFWKKNIFSKKLLVVAGILAVLSILQEIILIFWINNYSMLVHDITIVLPSLLGFFMIIKSYIGERND